MNSSGPFNFWLESQAKLTSDVARLTSDATHSRIDLAELKGVVGRFAASTALWAEQSDGRMSRLERTMGELAGRMDQLAGRMDELAGGMNTLIHVVEGHVTDETRHRPRPG